MPEFLDYDPPRRWAAAARVGDLLFLAGETGVDPVTMETAPGGVEAQTERAIANIAATLAHFGATLGDVVKMTTYLTDINDLAAVGGVKGRHFPRPVPSATVAVAALARDDLAVEIEVVAVVPTSAAKG